MERDFEREFRERFRFFRKFPDFFFPIFSQIIDCHIPRNRCYPRFMSSSTLKGIRFVPQSDKCKARNL